MKDLIRIMARSLVDKPEQVNVKEITGEQAMIFELRVSKDDVGKIIGKQGATVKAMRTILSAASAKKFADSTPISNTKEAASTWGRKPTIWLIKFAVAGKLTASTPMNAKSRKTIQNNTRLSTTETGCLIPACARGLLRPNRSQSRSKRKAVMEFGAVWRA